jgi:hypothetical protein
MLANFTHRQKKIMAIKMLSRQGEIETPEQKLCFGIIERAILDISEKEFPLRKHHSNLDWKKGNLEMACDGAGLDHSFARQTINQFGLLPEAHR